MYCSITSQCFLCVVLSSLKRKWFCPACNTELLGVRGCNYCLDWDSSESSTDSEATRPETDEVVTEESLKSEPGPSNVVDVDSDVDGRSDAATANTEVEVIPAQIIEVD